MTRHHARIEIRIMTTDQRGHDREAKTDRIVSVSDDAPLSEIAEDAAEYVLRRLSEERA